MRLFNLNRVKDITGVSGTGIVAQGVIFDNGKVVVTWLTGVSTITAYESIKDVEKINGHGGHTRIEYLDTTEATKEKYLYTWVLTLSDASYTTSVLASSLDSARKLALEKCKVIYHYQSRQDFDMLAEHIKATTPFVRADEFALSIDVDIHCKD